MIDGTYDDALGVIRFVSRGYTSLEEVEAFGRKTVPLLERADARGGHRRFLVDAADTPVHTQDVAARLADLAMSRLRPGDKTAIVIGSKIAKLQSQRMTKKDDTAFFETEADAMAWLLADPDA